MNDLEAYANLLEDDVNTSSINFDSIYDSFILTANNALIKKDSESLINLLSLFEDARYTSALRGVNDFFTINFLANVSNVEHSANSTTNIFNISDNVKDLCDCFQTIKFLIWRIDFLGESEACKILIQYLKDGIISIIFLHNALEHIAFYKTRTVLLLSSEFLHQNDYKNAILLIKLAYESNPNDMIILDELINLCDELNLKEMANTYRGIKNGQ